MKNKTFDGTEACPECGMEIDYKLNPYKCITVDCPHCGYKGAILCSLCDQPNGCNGGSDVTFCRESILETLKHYEPLTKQEIIDNWEEKSMYVDWGDGSDILLQENGYTLEEALKIFDDEYEIYLD